MRMRPIFRRRLVRAARHVVRPPEPSETPLSDAELLHGVMHGLIPLPSMPMLDRLSTRRSRAALPRR